MSTPSTPRNTVDVMHDYQQAKQAILAAIDAYVAFYHTNRDKGSCSFWSSLLSCINLSGTKGLHHAEEAKKLITGSPQGDLKELLTRLVAIVSNPDQGPRLRDCILHGIFPIGGRLRAMYAKKLDDQLKYLSGMAGYPVKEAAILASSEVLKHLVGGFNNPAKYWEQLNTMQKSEKPSHVPVHVAPRN
jgi:hypothetical protein